MGYSQSRSHEFTIGGQMGYYCDVMLITEYENKELVEGIFAKWAEHENASGGNVLSWAENPEGFEYTHYEGPYYNRREVSMIMWEWNQVRWGYDWAMTDEIIKDLEKELFYSESETGYGEYSHFGMIVVGEDDNDVHRYGHPSDYGMGIKTEITW